ncbi:9299_t:CDS:2, partial [Cetraspora pellucida]
MYFQRVLPSQPSAVVIAIIVGIVIGGLFILCSCLYRRRRQRVLPTLTPASRTTIRPGASYESAKRLEESSLEFRNRAWDEPISNIYKSS